MQTLKPLPHERVNIPDPNNSDARIVGFRIRESDEAWGEKGLSEPLFWLEKVLNTRPAAPVEGLYRALKEVRAKGERIKKEANAFQDVGASLEATIRIKVCDEILNLSGELPAPVEGLDTPSVILNLWDGDNKIGVNAEVVNFTTDERGRLELFTQSQAEVIIAAERERADAVHKADAKAFLSMNSRYEKAEADNATKDESIKDAKQSRDDWKKLAIDLGADNAALTARVEELEHVLAEARGNAKNASSNCIYWRGQTEALETQLAAARKAFEPFSKFAGALFERNFNNPDVVDRISAADGGVLQLTAKDFFEARAALEASNAE